MNREQLCYAFWAVAVLLAEVGIALFLDDPLIRPFVGDSLAVILVYLALRAATKLGPLPAAAVALGVATVVELGQLFELTRLLGLEGNPLARTLLGSAFDPLDLLFYAAGAALILGIEMVRMRGRQGRWMPGRARHDEGGRQGRWMP